MMSRGYTRNQLRDAIHRPLIIYEDNTGNKREGNIFELSSGMNYCDAEGAWKRVVSTLKLPPD